MKNSSNSASAIADSLAPDVDLLPPGGKLPSQRELVRRFGASASTIAQACAILAQRGLVEARPGAGAFRASTPTPRPPGDTSWQDAALELTENVQLNSGAVRVISAAGLVDTLTTVGPDVVDLNGGYLHLSLQPTAQLKAALSRVSRRAETWERPPIGGIAPLRDWFATDIGGGLTRENVLIAAGGQAALAATLRALTQPGDPVVIESPTYPGTLGAVRAAGLRAIPVSLDAEGMAPEHLDDALSRSRARVVVVQPLHQNPTGASMSRQRQARTRQIARDHGAFLIEDDFARHLTHADATRPPPPMIVDDPDGTVIHIRSLTKVTSPNMRIAALASRGTVTHRLRAALVLDSLLVPAVLQFTALEVVTATTWRRALAHLGTHLQHRRHTATTALIETLGARSLPIHPHGGYHLWVSLPHHHVGASVAIAALAQGFALTPGANYYPSGNDHQPFLRISYVAAPTASEVDSAIRRVGKIVEAKSD